MLPKIVVPVWVGRLKVEGYVVARPSWTWIQHDDRIADVTTTNDRRMPPKARDKIFMKHPD
jgi:hypothetical protein